MNVSPRRLLCITPATRLAVRYEDRKRVDACRIPAYDNVTWETLAQLEFFRDMGRVFREAQTS